jgi:aromatic ring-opening dioxygenase catalytic subunit (LigB family)
MGDTRGASIVYIPHGGGPLPLLGDEGHAELVSYLRALGAELPRPKAILVVSAHWEEDRPTITSSSLPGLLYDYYGFPDEAYRLRYPAQGDTALAGRVAEALEAAGFVPRLDAERGFDHGLFVPLSLMYPGADIPCVQLSLVRGLEPALHLRLGAALAALADEDLLALGSGFSFHNMGEFFGASGRDPRNEGFQAWLEDSCCDPGIAAERRLDKLAAWEGAPYARYCHPREEHLLPLHVCAGMAGGRAARAQSITVLGKRSLCVRWLS